MNTDASVVRRSIFERIRVNERVMDGFAGWLFVLPVVGGTLIFDALPMLPAFYLSMVSWDGFSAMTFQGFNNYSYVVKDPNFYRSVTYTLQYALTAVPLGILAGLLLALLVNQKIPGITAFRGVFYLPVVSSIVAIAVVFQYILAPQSGLLNMALFHFFGITGPSWLQSPGYAMASLVGVSVWTHMGYYMVMFLAGLQGIPVHLYEAATIDGAGGWSRLRHVTLPLLTPTLFLVVVISTINAFNVFSLVKVFTNGQEYNGTRVLFVYMYEEALVRFKFGLGSALSVMMFVGVGALTLLNWKLSQRWVFYG